MNGGIEAFGEVVVLTTDGAGEDPEIKVLAGVPPSYELRR